MRKTIDVARVRPKPSKSLSASRSGTKSGNLYRGIHLRSSSVRSTYSRDEIERAVDAAIEKNRDAFKAI